MWVCCALWGWGISSFGNFFNYIIATAVFFTVHFKGVFIFFRKSTKATIKIKLNTPLKCTVKQDSCGTLPIKNIVAIS